MEQGKADPCGLRMEKDRSVEVLLVMHVDVIFVEGGK